MSLIKSASRKLVPYALEIADEAYRTRFLNGLHERMELHPKQLQIAQAVFAGYNVTASCGRKFGKSSLVQYIALRKAALFKKAYIYVILPSLKQAREIYWEQLIIPDICPDGFITRRDKGDLRVGFSSGSFIKFDGSDNPELHRGPAVHLFIPDELKDCDPKLMPAMLPNLLATRGTFAAFGTPPDEEESPEAKMWFEIMDRHLIDPKTKYFEGSSSDNPHNDKSAIKRERQRLIDSGREDEFDREYRGIYKRSTVESVFPMWSDKAHVAETQEVLDEVTALGDEVEYWLIQDPGSSSVFAQLYLAYHKKTAMLYILDEGYVTDPRKATVLEMYRMEIEKCGAIEGNLAAWQNVYDEQAVWFFNERVNLGVADGLMATEKNKWRVTHAKDLKAGLTTVRDILTYGRIKVAKRCENFIEEVRGYRKAQIKRKAKDHLIDCLRYFVLKSYYSIPTEVIADLSSISVEVKKKIEATVQKGTGLAFEDLDEMIALDISEMMVAEALKWDGW